MDEKEEIYHWQDWTPEKKAERLAETMDWLNREKIAYTSHNNGLHIKVTIGDEIIDYWPTTGRFKRDNVFFSSDLNYLINLTTTKENHDQ